MAGNRYGEGHQRGDARSRGARGIDVFRKFIAAEYAYFTPRGDPLCWPVTPYLSSDGKTLSVATGLAYPNKGIYPKTNPKVALFFSDPTGSGAQGASPVLVQGEARVLDEDIQANTDRYVKAIREKFAVARFAINPLTVKLLDFYLPRIWVEIPLSDAHILEPSGPAEIPQPPSELPGSPLAERESEALQKIARRITEAVAVVKGPEGFPSMIRTSVTDHSPGRLRIDAVPGFGRACLTFHTHTLGGTRFNAYMARGALHPPGIFVAERIVGFFGNGAVFPFSVIPNIANLRRRLRLELAARNQPMPVLRIPRR